MKINSISASRSKTYETCSFKYIMTYHLWECLECLETFYDREAPDKVCPACKCTKIHKIAMKSNWGAVHGTALHWILEKYVCALRGKYEDGTAMPQHEQRHFLNWRERIEDIYKTNPPFQDNIQFELLSLAKPKDFDEIPKMCKGCPFYKKSHCTITNKLPDDMKGCPKKLFEESINLIEKMLFDLKDIFNKEILGTEQAFELSFGDDSHGNPIKVNGFVDLIVKVDDTTIELFDYKFGNFTQTYDEVVNDIQARIYSIAIKKLYPGYENYILNFQYVKGKPITCVFSDEDDEKTKASVIQSWEQIAQTSQKITRISNKPETFWKCKYMCDAALCNKEWKKFVEKFKQ